MYATDTSTYNSTANMQILFLLPTEFHGAVSWGNYVIIDLGHRHDSTFMTTAYCMSMALTSLVEQVEKFTALH